MKEPADPVRARPGTPGPVVLLAFLGGGAVIGVGAKLADGAATWAGDAATYLAVWVVAVALIGAFAPTPVQAALRSAVAFLGMCAGYYAWTGIVLGYPVGREAIVWTALALSAVPLLAVCVQWARSGDRWWSGIVFAGVAALCLVDGAIGRVVIAVTEEVPEAFLASVRPVQAVIEVLGSAVIVLLLPRTWRSRAIALLAVTPLAFLLGALLTEARSLIGV